MLENFRNSSLRYYGLLPSHYLTVPDLSWDSILNMSKVELDSDHLYGYAMSKFLPTSGLKWIDPKK